MVQHLSPATDQLDQPALRARVLEAGGTVAALREVQEAVGWLPPQALRLIASTLNVPLARIHGVATFYSGFHLEPRGRRVLRVCRGTVCHVAGADRLIDALGKHLDLGIGETSEDLSFTLESAACLGCCSLAPVLAEGEQTWGRLDGARAVAVVAERTGDHLDGASVVTSGEP